MPVQNHNTNIDYISYLIYIYIHIYIYYVRCKQTYEIKKLNLVKRIGKDGQSASTRSVAVGSTH